MNSSESIPARQSDAPYTIPDFVEDEKLLAEYEHFTITFLEQEVRDAQNTARQRHNEQRMILRQTRNEANEARREAADRSNAKRKIYRDMLPHRLRPPFGIERPGLWDMVKTFGRCILPYREAVESKDDLDRADAKLRAYSEALEKLDASIDQAIADAERQTREFYASPAGVAKMRRSPQRRELALTCEAITAERNGYAERLRAGDVSNGERRDRALAMKNRRILAGSVRGLYICGDVTLLEEDPIPERWLLARDRAGREWVLPHSPDLDAFRLTCIDIFRNPNGSYTVLVTGEVPATGSSGRPRQHETEYQPGMQFDPELGTALVAVVRGKLEDATPPASGYSLEF